MAYTGRNRQLGIIGGVLIALAALMTGTGFTISTSGLGTAYTLVLFAAGIGVIVFLLTGRLNWAVYSAIAAATIALIEVLALVVDNATITLRLVVLVVGVILALLATTWHHRR
jgi:hypothetical protein